MAARVERRREAGHHARIAELRLDAHTAPGDVGDDQALGGERRRRPVALLGLACLAAGARDAVGPGRACRSDDHTLPDAMRALAAPPTRPAHAVAASASGGRPPRRTRPVAHADRQRGGGERDERRARRAAAPQRRGRIRIDGKIAGAGIASAYRAAEAIIAALSVHSASGAKRGLRQRRAQLRVGRDPADDRDPLGADLRRRLASSADERADDRPLVARREVGPAALELLRAEVTHGVEQRRLQPREREVESRHAGDRERERLRIARRARAGRSRHRRGSPGRAGARPCRTPRRPRRRASCRARGSRAAPARRAGACGRRLRAGRGTAARGFRLEVERGDVAVQVVDRHERSRRAQASALAAERPTRSAPISPGPP